MFFTSVSLQEPLIRLCCFDPVKYSVAAPNSEGATTRKSIWSPRSVITDDFVVPSPGWQNIMVDLTGIAPVDADSGEKAR